MFGRTFANFVEVTNNVFENSYLNSLFRAQQIWSGLFEYFFLGRLGVEDDIEVEILDLSAIGLNQSRLP